YTEATGTNTIDIAQATPTVVVEPLTVAYDGTPHGTTGEAYGINGANLGPVDVSYDTADGSAPVDPGTYTATGTFDGDEDYTSATGTASIDINKLSLTASWHTYKVSDDGSITIDGGGIDVIPQIDGAPLPVAARVAVYWAKGESV